jgi:tRNA (cytidine/uridine-2'-O-)-methyltransferase
MPRRLRLFLVFGSETKGLAPDIIATYAENTYHIPITAAIRSLNLSTAAGIAVYESLRHIGPTHAYQYTRHTIA